jgi:hypothetical protein
MGAFSALGIALDDNLAYSVLFLGFFMVMFITKASQRPLPPIICKRAHPKPLLPIATPFNPLDFLTGRKMQVPEDDEFAAVHLNPVQPELYSMSTRSRRNPIKI